MPRGFIVLLLGIAVLLSAEFSALGKEVGSLSAEEEVFFETRIRPVLAGTCVECHGPKTAYGGLRLDTREGLLKGGDRGPAILPGDAEGSLLVRAIRHAENEPVQMPPDEPLPAEAIADFKGWIAAGAKWPASAKSPLVSNSEHWAFQPLAAVAPPNDPAVWSDDPVDCFIAAARAKQGLQPNPPAEKHVLLRRAFYDLIGLPPTPEDLEAFLADERPEAFAEVVDELLASPHYGERWGRYWLDLVRYADTAGDNSDYPIPQAHLYRDYVIDAFNADLPYDRFLREQLAGDLLARDAPLEDYQRLIVATGFIAQAKRMGTRELEDMHIVIEDTLATVGPAILGLSLRCARCHDHKFEPLTQKDYYALYGIFASTQYPFPGAEEVKKQTHFVPLIHPEELRRLEGNDSLATVPTAYAVGELKPTDARIQVGGNPRELGETVPRGVPRVLDTDGISIPEGTSGRLELARWITEDASFLTARVMANRIWQFHFGKPLAPTPSDFGYRGAPPTHPELLDWLATEFIASGWSVKAMHRKLMLTKTYQLSSEASAASAERDTGNMWYWRFERRRLDAESLRDTLLTLGGSLDLTRPGAHPFPEPSKWRFTAHHQFNPASYPSNHRSVYLMVQRLHAHPYLSLFNGADPSLSTAIRDNSTVSLQSLFLLNNILVHEQSAGFAKRLLAEEADSADRVRRAFLLAYARPPHADEQDRATSFLAQYEAALEQEGVAASERSVEAWSALARSLLASNELMYVD
jgi:hypothetical protein